MRDRPPELEGITHGQHLCQLYDDPDQREADAAAFLAGGLRRGERCVYLASGRDLDDLRTALAELDVDVGNAARRQRLLLRRSRDVYLGAEGVRPRRMVRDLEREEARALRDGFAGLRVAGEMSWVVADDTGPRDLVEYETLLNGYLPGARRSALCQYDRRRIPQALCGEVLRTHPFIVLSSRVLSNHFHEPRPVVEGDENDRIEWRIAEIRRLEKTVRELEDECRAKAELLAATSHDLRTPVNGILGYADLFLEGLSGPLTRKQRRRISSIRTSARLVGETLDRLLTAARSDTRLEARADAVPLPRLIDDVAAAIRPLAERKALALRTTGPDERVLLRTDGVMVRQVLLNLLSNAVKYTDRGGVELAARVERRHAGVVFRVRDSGEGIPPEDRERVFDPFWRAEPWSENGTGIGLSVARRLSRLLGGDLTLESEVGVGTTFTFRLPVDGRRPPAPRHPGTRSGT